MDPGLAFGPLGLVPAIFLLYITLGPYENKFKDKIVFIGWKAAGIGDFWVTPTAPALPGVEKQATIVSNILHQDFIIRNKSLVIWDIALILVTGFLSSLLIPRLSPMRATLFTIIFWMVLAAFLQSTFSHAKLWLYSIYPFLTVVLAYSSTTPVP